ncbi:MAG: ATP-binding cassette domain-containing protein [Myxococcota bacterium]|nr:ATP-binding cassette domain-containing protein [Myxococcota bacterium]
MIFSLAHAGVTLGGTSVLSDVSLDIRPGEVVGLVGPSGAGKTTLLRLLDGSRVPDTGTAHATVVRSEVGFIHQDLALVPTLRVLQNVLAGAAGKQGLLRAVKSAIAPSRAEVAAVHALLERVGIGEKLYQRTDTLSGGQQQRVAVARALYQRPSVLLADEPVSSVDPHRADATLRWLLGLCAADGLTAVISLHDLTLARRHLPRLVGLKNGTVRYDGPPEGLDASALYAPESR